MQQTHYAPITTGDNPTAPRLAALAREVAADLPGEWEFVPSHSHQAILRDRQTGLQIALRYERGRLEISQRHQIGPRNQRHFGSHRIPTPRITVSQERAPRAVAADLARRLLPTAHAEFAEECSYIADCYAREQQHEQQIRLIEQITGHRRCSNSEETIYLPRGKARVVRGGSIEIELSLDLETAADLLEWLRQQ
jgi:hypothetical protein